MILDPEGFKSPPHLQGLSDTRRELPNTQEHKKADTSSCTMRFNTLLLLLSLSCLYLALAQVSYEDCCLKYVRESSVPKKHAVVYRRQETDGGCNIPATIFIMRRGRVVCANPKEAWVVQLMSKIDLRGRKAGNARIQHHKRRRV